jgi:hypothetical protein
MLYWLLQSPLIQKSNRLVLEGVNFLKWQWAFGEAGSTSAALPAIGRSTFPREQRPKDLSILQRDIHLIEIEYCENTGPQNQLSTAQEQHKGLCAILQEASITLHTILLGEGGTIYDIHALKPFKELGLDFQRAKKLATNFIYILSTTLPNLSIERRTLTNTTINSHHELVSGQACNPPDPHRYSLPLAC